MVLPFSEASFMSLFGYPIDMGGLPPVFYKVIEQNEMGEEILIFECVFHRTTK